MDSAAEWMLAGLAALLWTLGSMAAAWIFASWHAEARHRQELERQDRRDALWMRTYQAVHPPEEGRVWPTPPGVQQRRDPATKPAPIRLDVSKTGG